MMGIKKPKKPKVEEKDMDKSLSRINSTDIKYVSKTDTEIRDKKSKLNVKKHKKVTKIRPYARVKPKEEKVVKEDKKKEVQAEQKPKSKPLDAFSSYQDIFVKGKS